MKQNNKELARDRLTAYRNRGKVLRMTQSQINGDTSRFTQRAVVAHKDFSWLAKVKSWIRSWIDTH